VASRARAPVTAWSRSHLPRGTLAAIIRTCAVGGSQGSRFSQGDPHTTLRTSSAACAARHPVPC
jgi:hypothetical protein